MGKVAFLTGVTGMDGSYLSEMLIEKGYEVHGLIRRCSTTNNSRIVNIPDIKLHYGDLTETASLCELMYQINPDEIYALGAQSQVKVSFEIPTYTADVTGIGTLRILEAIKKTGIKSRIMQAGSSEQFGSANYPQNEETIFIPESPYAAAKIFSYHMVKIYRKSYNMFASNAISMNHESERRGEEFVTRKITRAATRIKLGLQDKLILGNINAYRDWGHSKDFCRAFWLMLQHSEPDDFLIATGEAHTVKEFLEMSFDKLGLDPYKYLIIDKNLYRPSEVNYLLGDPSKIKKILGWEPQIKFKELVGMMVDNDMRLAELELELKNLK